MKTLTIFYYMNQDKRLQSQLTKFTTKCDTLEEAKKIVETFDFVSSWIFE